LPTVAEWRLVAQGDGRSPYPWGQKPDRTRANTGELGLYEATPVGTFESGRKASGDAPYDLIGNVSEWTESVPWRWCEGREVLASFTRCRARVLATPALAVWSLPVGVVPLGAIAAAGGLDVPHTVVGADFQSLMSDLYAEQMPRERRQRTGLRIYTTAAELLRALLATEHRPNEADREQLARFLRRGRHGVVLRDALRELQATEAAVPVGAVGDAVLRALSAPADAEGPR
jgi:hypothetical protein